MSREISPQISISIDRKLSGLSNTTSNEQFIFKVHDGLRSHKKEAYEPKVLSIGPYHHGKPKLKKMEMHKLRYLQELLGRRGETNADRYIIALTEFEDRARKYYAEEEISGISKKDFVEMMFLDGCFVIEFLRKIFKPELRNGNDTIFQMEWLSSNIMTDLILFENQVPFFILDKLFEMTKLGNEQGNLIHFAHLLCDYLVHGTGNYPEISANDVIHLLDLVHKSLCSSFAETLTQINESDVNDLSDFIRSTTELRQCGIQFEVAPNSQLWLNITFENGKLKIPRLTISDSTESVFRNLIAYEQYILNSWSCISDYALFLDRLIDSPSDVAELRHRQIIWNWLGDDEAVSTMFNKLYNDIRMNNKFCYTTVFQEVNNFSRKRRNKWRANLMRKYFNTPWSIISFVAALVLLILTFVQTIFSILI
ncbi:hypothetical protein ACH5RR_031656 [Cinchona calisaya]|uniref:Uncharacterized protein n=1 Tax=Cinchona calisaya TaxID=153742 RepID=A0ABD2YJX6_9GENT